LEKSLNWANTPLEVDEDSLYCKHALTSNGIVSTSWSSASSINSTAYSCSYTPSSEGTSEVSLIFRGSQTKDEVALSGSGSATFFIFYVESISPASGPISGGTQVNLTGEGFLSLSDYGSGFYCQFGS